MPTNLTIEYSKKNQEYQNATTPAQKIRILRELIAVTPKHKGTEKLLSQLKKNLSKLEGKQESERRAKKSRGKRGIKKTAPLVVIIGPENSGKTTVFKALTGEGKPKRWPFSTQIAKTAMGSYKGARIQFIDCPSFDFSYANNAEVVLLTKRDEKLEKKFKSKKIIFFEEDQEELLRKLWDSFGLIRVYTDGGKEPMTLKKGATVRAAALDIHKTIYDTFEWAKVKRGKKTFRVGLDYKLHEDDIVWIKSRL
ncbi:MAG: TGS domain-containing protein [Candidatus Altiarchaeota archaeon]|nr:TGS domain-containing protein [Candidatus Altiarchaeota archaeon]